MENALIGNARKCFYRTAPHIQSREQLLTAIFCFSARVASCQMRQEVATWTRTCSDNIPTASGCKSVGQDLHFLSLDSGVEAHLKPKSLGLSNQGPLKALPRVLSDCS